MSDDAVVTVLLPATRPAADDGLLWPATTDADAEAMRVIRNSCRQFMTRDTSEIDPARQRAWFAALDRAVTKPWLYRVDGTAAGYGLVRLEAGRWWLSGGLLPSWRGRGHGRRLFAALAEIAGRPCWLDVRADNAAARRLYERLGFAVAGERADGAIIMRLP